MRQEEGEAVHRALRILRGEGTGCLWQHLARELISIAFAELRLETWAARQGLALSDSEDSPSDDGKPWLATQGQAKK